jgi:hypothetical protein
MDMRTVVLTIEVDTVLSVEELKDLQALVFGRMRSDSYADKHRMTIKHHMPAGVNHDVRGVIKQVQANVVKGKPKAEKKKSSSKSKAKKTKGSKDEPVAAAG